MKQISIKNRLYILSTLLLCINFQITIAATTTTTKTTQSENETSLITRGGRRQDQYQKQNNAHSESQQNMHEPQYIIWSPNMAQSQNMPATYNMPEWQNNTGQYNTNYASQQNNAESYTVPETSDYYTGQQNITSWDTMAKSQNSPGFLDANFGSGKGYAIRTMGFRSAVRGVAIQENNKIVVAGVRDNYPVLARYTEHGTLDYSFANNPSFGPGVIIQTDLGKGSFFNAVTIQKSDQKIVAVGGIGNKCLLARYQQKITDPIIVVLDQSFGDKGIIKTDITGELNAVTVQKDGKILVAGNDTGQIKLIRYNIDGSLDHAFGTQGIVFLSVGATPRAGKVIIQEDDNIVVVGSNSNSMFVARYDKHGRIDRDFGSNRSGIVTLQLGISSSAYDVAIQKNGRIIVVGNSISQDGNSLFTTIRLHRDGTRDISFGPEGVRTITPTKNNNHNAYARSVALNENEKITVMGYTMDNTQGNPRNYFSLVRYNPNGTLDTTFGEQETGIQNNLLTLDNFPNLSSLPVVGVMQDNKKKLVLAGSYTPVAITPNNWAVARYWN